MKNEIRKEMKFKRLGLTVAERAGADGQIEQNFIAAFGRYSSFFIYNSFSGEADTKNIVKKLLSLGKKVYLPRVEGENIFAVPYGKTFRGALGIYEPSGQAYDGEIDVTVIPLLAVNQRGFRLGYGKGYYDRYLKNRKTLKIGIGFSFQLTEFSEDGWDEPLDMFVCENGIHVFDVYKKDAGNENNKR